MSIDLNNLKNILQKALNDFFTREVDAMLARVNERNNCGRLAIYLQQHATDAGLSTYYADPEYNRKQGGQIKTILDRKMQIITINCDLILHSRGASIAEDNLIAIEMKKADRPESEKNDDRNRLRAMTKKSFDDTWSNDGTTHPEHVCGYKLGLYIELDASKREAILEYYQSGRRVSTPSVQKW
jgi:hypothetical protein